MIQRVFQLEDSNSAALQRLGAAMVLQWANIPPGVRDAIVQQALALDWSSEPEAAAERIRALLRSESEPGAQEGSLSGKPGKEAG